jgi:hypothetical protein
MTRTRDELLTAKASEVQEALEKWARDEKLLRPGEQIQFHMTVVNVGLIAQIDMKEFDPSVVRVVDFFTYTRLVRLGATTAIATRTRNAILNDMTTERRFEKVFPDGRSTTVKEWLETYSSIREIRLISDIGEKSLSVIIATLREVGIYLD